MTVCHAVFEDFCVFDRYFPVLVKIPEVYRIRDVRCGVNNSVLIGENGMILAMGSNEYNKLNLNNRQNILVQMKLSKAN